MFLENIRDVSLQKYPGSGYAGSQLHLEQEDASITAGSAGPQKERTPNFEIFIFRATFHLRLQQGSPLRSSREGSLTTQSNSMQTEKRGCVSRVDPCFILAPSQ